MFCVPKSSVSQFLSINCLEMPECSLGAPSVCWKNIWLLDKNSKTKESIKIFCRIFCLSVEIFVRGTLQYVEKTVTCGENWTSENFAVKQRLSMLGFPPIFCLIMSKKLGFRWKVFMAKYHDFLAAFFVPQCQKLRRGTLQYVEKLVLDKRLIDQKRGYHDFWTKILT